MDNGDGTYTSYKNLPAVTVNTEDLVSAETLAAMAPEGNVAVAAYTPDPQELDAYYQQLRGAV